VAGASVTGEGEGAAVGEPEVPPEPPVGSPPLAPEPPEPPV